MVILVLSHLCNVRSVTGKGLILCSALGEAVNCLIPRDARMRTARQAGAVGDAVDNVVEGRRSCTLLYL